MPANWRAFEGDIPNLKPIVLQSLKAHGLSPIDDPNQKSKVVTQWQYSSHDTLQRQRQHLIVSWEVDKKENAVVVYVRHEAQEIESNVSLGVEYNSISPNLNLESVILDDISRRILNVSKP